jgi:hypothetical protein
MSAECFQLYGQPEPPPALIPLQAGKLTLLYDPASGMLRRIKLGEREVLRGIYAAVRDRNWGTVPGTIRETTREIAARSFRIEFESSHQQDEIHYVWRGAIHGTADGTIRYVFEGEAKTSFLRNRIGFCVLHPIAECAGARARQTRTDGRPIEGRFPDLIEPQIFRQSSFQQLRTVAHEVTPGVWAEIAFTGDTFEMEDQRNWTDASFKTYCTPLALPFPVEVKTRDHVRQEVKFHLIDERTTASAANNANPPSESDLVTLTIPKMPTGSLPTIGLGAASHGEPLTIHEVDELRRLKLSHLRVDVRLAEPSTMARLEQSFREAEQLGVGLELALHLPRDGEADPRELLSLLATQSDKIVRVLALREGEAATSVATLAGMRKQLGSLPIPIGAGSDCNFCELNREQARGNFALSEADEIFWSVNPQVHAFDHLSIMETLEAQAATVASARAFAKSRPLIVSPITLKQRFNPVATKSDKATTPGDLPAAVDPRQLSQFAAAWTLGSIVALAGAGATSLTYYETTGWRGVLEREVGSPAPGKFPSMPGAPFPMFDVFAQIAGFRQFAVVHTTDPTCVTALALFAAGQLQRLLVANLTDRPQHLKLEQADGHQRMLKLAPYAITQSSLHT